MGKPRCVSWILKACAVVSFAFCLLGNGLQSLAAQREWTGQATPGPSGFYETAGNWALSLPPTIDDQAVFGVAAPYTVTLATSPTLGSAHFSAGHVTLDSSTLTTRQLTTLLDWTQSGAGSTLDNIGLSVGGGVFLEGSSTLHMPNTDLLIGGTLAIGSTASGDALVVVGTQGGTARIDVIGVTRVGNVAGGTGTLQMISAEGHFNAVLAVGSAGSGLMEVKSGSTVSLDGTLLVASQFGPNGSGKLVIDGAGSLFDIAGSGEAAIGVIGRTAEVHITGGGYFSSGLGATDIASGSKLLVDAGEGVIEGVLRLKGTLEVTSGGKLATVGAATIDGQVFVEQGGHVTHSTIVAANAAGSAALISVEDPGSRIDASTFRAVHNSQLNVASGGHLTASVIALATAKASHVQAHVVADGATLAASHIVLGGDFVGGLPIAGGQATMGVGFGGVLEYAESLHILGNSLLTLDGGELRAPSFATLKDASFLFEAGTYTVTGSATIDASIVANLPSGGLDFGRALTVEGTATLGAPVTLDGGKLAAGQIVGGGLLNFDSGTVAITGVSGLTIGTSGALGSTIELTTESHLEVTHSLTVAASGHLVVAGGRVSADHLVNHGQLELNGPTSQVHSPSIDNHGQISGGGRLMGGPVANAQDGIIAIAAGRQLRLGGTGHTNAGRVEMAAGRLEVDGHFTNLPSGDIVGRGTLSFGGGFTNQGDLILAAGATDIFGDVTNTPGAKVLVSGGAEVVFWDDVTHNGTTFNVSAGSSVTFFGEAGFSLSGSGDVYFEEDISPGSSPGLSQFGGDVYFGGGSHLLIELAGNDRGTQYDALTIADTAFLGGELTVELLDGFVPQVGSQFLLLSASGREGEFSQVHLPYIGSGRAFTTHYDANSMWLSVVATDSSSILAGDYNDDGVVDAGDYVVWRNHVGTGVTLANDGVGGPIGAAHYSQWKENFGARRDLSLTAAVASLPEPTTLAVSLLPAAILLASRRAAGRPFRSRRHAG